MTLAFPRSVVAACSIAASLLAVPAPAPAADLVGYDDMLQSGFADWSWAVRDLASTATVHAGATSISFEPDNWQAVYLHRDAGIDVAQYRAFDFWIDGGAAGGQSIDIVFLSGGVEAARAPLTRYLAAGPPAGTWARVTVDLDALGLGGVVLDGVWLADATGANQATAWLDDVTFVERPAGPPQPVAVTVDPSADRRPVSPLIYGVNFGDPTDPAEPRYTVRRWGGNGTTRYSWQDDITNHASDWFFYSIENNPDPGTLPDGSSSDRYIDAARASGAEVVLTVPTIGWAPIDRTRRWGFSVAKYGAQQQTECTATGNPSWCNPDAGNGVRTDGSLITGNDPTDTSRVVGPSYVTAWQAHVAARTGTAGAGGLRLFALDNEPMLWSSTHRDVHPQRLGDDELWQKTLDYAEAIKAQDPAAQVFGPDSWGWCDYFWSDLDGCGNDAGRDHAAHGDLLEWYAQQVCDRGAATGTRPVDWLDVHYYPQAGGVALSDDESGATSALRLRSVRGLWDPAYVDESWVGQTVMLIPRLRQIIASRCPGLKLALTEYNWGNDDGLSSALAQVEVLGVMGREGVDLATRWVAPSAGSLVEDAFRLFLDYDRAGSRVTGDSVRATSTVPDAVQAFAVRAADDTLYVVLVNQATGPRSVSVAAGLPDGPASAFGFDGSSRLARMADVAASGGAVTLDMPARSARLIVSRVGCAPPSGPATDLRVRRDRAARTILFTWEDPPGSADGVVRSDLAARGGAFTTLVGASAPGVEISAPQPTEALVFYLAAGRTACGEGPLR